MISFSGTSISFSKFLTRYFWISVRCGAAISSAFFRSCLSSVGSLSNFSARSLSRKGACLAAKAFSNSAICARIVRVVVAAGAADGEAHDRGAEDLHLSGHSVITVGEKILLRAVGGVGTHAEEAGGDQVLDLFGAVLRLRFVIEQLVASQLF